MDVLVELETNEADSSASSAKATARIMDLWGHDRSRETARCRWYARPADIADDVLSTHPHADELAPNEIFVSNAEANVRITSIVRVCRVAFPPEENPDPDAKENDPPVFYCRSQYFDKKGTFAMVSGDDMATKAGEEDEEGSESGDGNSQRGDESRNASQDEDEDGLGSHPLSGRSRTMSGQKTFDLTSPMKHESSRVGDDFQASIPPLSLGGSMEVETGTPVKSKRAVDEGSSTRSTKKLAEESKRAFQEDEAAGDGEINEMIWDASWIPNGFDVDAFTERVKGIKDPEPGTVLRYWNPTSNKCSWCVFLRLVDDKDDSTSSGKDDSVSRVAGSSSNDSSRSGAGADKRKRKIAKIAVGERNQRPKEAPMEQLMGWTNHVAVIETLRKHAFDAEKAYAELEKNYDTTGYWRDKFSRWNATEVAILSENASRHQDDLPELQSLLDTKEALEVTEFYDHMLRNSTWQELQSLNRLFQVAEHTRAGDDYETMAKDKDGDGEGRGYGQRKSKREKRTLTTVLPGEQNSDDEAPQHATRTGTRKRTKTEIAASADDAKKQKRSHKGGKGAQGAGKKGGKAATTPEMWLDQTSSITPKQQNMLRESFDFLHRAREALEPKKFTKLIRALVAYDKGTKDIPDLVSESHEVLQPHQELIGAFHKFLPAAAQTQLTAAQQATTERAPT